MADDRAAQARLLALLAPLHDRARATARRLAQSSADGDDLFHEAVLRACERLGDLRDESRFPAWFHAIVLSIHRTRHRRSFWRRLVPLAALTQEPAAPQREDEAFAGADRAARALATLSPEMREAIVLFELSEFTIEEVAALQRTTVPAVKSRLVRARARLRLFYEKQQAMDGSLAPVPTREGELT